MGNNREIDREKIKNMSVEEHSVGVWTPREDKEHHYHELHMKEGILRVLARKTAPGYFIGMYEKNGVTVILKDKSFADEQRRKDEMACIPLRQRPTMEQILYVHDIEYMKCKLMYAFRLGLSEMSR